jgi:hypothetical protein
MTDEETPKRDHYLILEWAEEPDNGTWSDNLDWHISHPPECERFVDPVNSLYSGFRCVFQYEIDNIGVAAFSEQGGESWPEVPSATPIDHFVERWADEVDTAIIPKDTP